MSQPSKPSAGGNAEVNKLGNERGRQPSEYPAPRAKASDLPDGAAKRAADEIEKRHNANEDAAEMARKALLGY